MILIPCVQVGIKMHQSHRAIVEVPGSPQQTPSECMVTTKPYYYLGFIPEPLGEEIDLVHGGQDVKWCGGSITCIGLLCLYVTLQTLFTSIIDPHL